MAPESEMPSVKNISKIYFLNLKNSMRIMLKTILLFSSVNYLLNLFVWFAEIEIEIYAFRNYYNNSTKLS